MFSNLNKPTFGSSAPGTSFGLGASTANTAGPWGNAGNTQLFGKTPTTGFGQPPSTSFGQPSTSSNSMFSFFPQTNTTGFGTTPANQTTFGSNLFGQQQQQQPATNTLFGSTTFGQQKQTGFGFGTQNQQQPNLFGQPAQPQSSLFQPSSSTNLFGSSNAFGSTTVGSGTTVKFNPVTGTDTMQKSGVTTSINTKHHCITCMKEYEGKSLEELRLEDYQANRKGPQNQFGSAPFGSTPSMFGQTTENKPAFGQSTGFGQLSGTTFGQPNQSFGLGTQQPASSNIFEKPPAFGSTGTTNNGFGFNTASNVTNAFGVNQNKPFGATSTAPLFGATQPQQQTTPFGSNLFGQSNQNTTGSFFNKPAQTSGFASGGFGFNQTPATTQSNIFQQSKPLFGLGQPSSTPAFGQTAAFGQNTQQNSFGVGAFGKPLTFGQTQSTFQPVSQASLFPNTQQKTASLLTGSGGGLFGTNTFGNTSTFGISQPTMQLQTQMYSVEPNQESKNLSILANDQFGHTPFLTGLLPVDKSSSPTLYTTNPKEIKKMLENNKKVDETISNTKIKLKLGPPKTQRDNLFEEGNEEDVNKLYKTSCKRLVLKKRQEESKQSIFETNSICNELSFKNPDSSLLSIPTDISTIRKINSPTLSQNDVELTPTSSGHKNFEVKFVNKNFAKEDLETLVIPKSSAMSIEDSVISGHEEIEATVGNATERIDIPQGLEEPAKKTNSVISISTSDTESTITKDPQKIVVSSEIAPSEGSTLIDTTPRKIGPSGIVLTRAEYYTLPTIEELDALVGEDGRCMVKGFTIGRRGYGNVHYPDELDIINLNLDEIVHFRFKEVHIYPDESKKPPIGEGLNRQAQVTLDKIYPRVKETKEVIDDVERILAAKFPAQLVEISAKHGLKFLDYRPETGSWVFMVDHFSKYAFTESDEEDCELSNLKQKEKNSLKKVADKLITEEDKCFLEPEEEDQVKRNAEILLDNMEADLGSEYTDEGDQRQGDVLHKSMTIDLEGNDIDFINPAYEPSDQDIFYHNSHIQMMKATFFSDSECASTISSMDYFDGPYKPQLLDIKAKTYHRMPPQRPKVWKVYINIASRPDESLLLKSSRCFSDIGVFRGKSFKVGWSRGYRNYAVKFPTHADFDTCLSLSVRTVAATNTSEVFKNAIAECIKLAQECSDFTLTGKDKIPTFKIMRDRTYLMACHKIFKKSATDSDGKSEILYNDVWSLCNALWGPGRRSIPFVKSRLSLWLKNSIQYKVPKVKDLQCLTIEELLTIIFNQLTCFNIQEAAETAMNSNLPNLSMIISQINLSPKLKLQLNQQLESWYNSMYADHIGPEMMKIYLLLSGNPVNRDVSVCEGLDWKRAFGTHLWYFTNEGAPVQAAIEAYTKGFSSVGYAAEPKPSYETDEETTSYDILYHVFQLYKNRSYRLIKALNPETYTNIKIDYQLSWLLLLFFQSVDVGLVDDSEETQIHTSFSAQLEENGLWDLAILPLLYLKDNCLKKNLVLGILNRNLATDNEKTKSIETKLVQDFHVPYDWINTIKTEKNNQLVRDK